MKHKLFGSIVLAAVLAVSGVFIHSVGAQVGAQANVSLDPSSPLMATLPVTDTTNGQYLGLPVLTFDVNAQNASLHLHEVKIKVSTTGSGVTSAAYLYQGSTMISSAAISNGVADFANIADGTNGASIPVNTTVPFTVKVDVSGISAGSQATVLAQTGDVVIYTPSDVAATISGSAMGNALTLISSGPLLTLSGMPTISTTNISYGSSVTVRTTATFNVNVQAVGTDVTMGLPGSSYPAFSGTTLNGVGVLTNGLLSSISSYAPINVSYSVPTGATISSDGNSFTIARNQIVTIPVTYTFAVQNPGSNVCQVQIRGIAWTSNGAAHQSTFMANQPSWRTGIADCGNPNATPAIIPSTPTPTPTPTVAPVALASPLPTSPTCFRFTRNLGVGTAMTSQEMIALQAVLQFEGISTAGLSGTTYNEAYASAVVKLQGILIGTQTGYFGPLTRAAVNGLNWCGSNTASSGGYSNGGSGSVSPTCPAGFTCAPVTPVTPPQCPAGYTCTPITTTTGGNTTSGVTSSAIGSTWTQANYYGSSYNSVYGGPVNMDATNAAAGATVGSTNLSQGEVATFGKTFNVSTTNSPVKIVLAADNQFSLTVNGSLVQNNLNEWNFAGLATIDITQYVHVGSNTLSITVTNLVTPGTNPAFKDNPAGLIYVVTQNTTTLASSDGSEMFNSSTRGKGYASVLSSRDPLWNMYLNGVAKWIWSYDGYSANSSYVTNPYISPTPTVTPTPTPSSSPVPVYTNASISVTYPTAGQNVTAGQNIGTVVWSDSNLPSGSTIDSLQFALVGSNGSVILLSVPKSSQYTSGFSGYFTANGQSYITGLPVPATTPAGSYQLRVSCSSCGTSVSGLSPAFNVLASAGTPSISVSYPTAGMSLNLGQTVGVRWSTMNMSTADQVSIYAVSYGTNVLMYPVALNVANSGSYNWLIPSTIPAGTYAIQVSCTTCQANYGAGPTFGWSGSFTVQAGAAPTVSPTPSPTPTSNLSSAIWDAVRQYYMTH